MRGKKNEENCGSGLLCPVGVLASIDNKHMQISVVRFSFLQNLCIVLVDIRIWLLVFVFDFLSNANAVDRCAAYTSNTSLFHSYTLLILIIIYSYLSYFQLLVVSSSYCKSLLVTITSR
jgi:hypothetical protein